MRRNAMFRSLLLCCMLALAVFLFAPIAASGQTLASLQPAATPAEKHDEDTAMSSRISALEAALRAQSAKIEALSRTIETQQHAIEALLAKSTNGRQTAPASLAAEADP